MNNIQVTLTEGTITNFLKGQLNKIDIPDKEVPLADKNGIKVVGNVNVKKVEFDEFDLSSPDIMTVKKVNIEFEKLNIVVSVDIKHIKEKKVIEIPDIPPTTFRGRVIFAGREIPDIVLWDIDLFGSNEDIKLTVGAEKFVKPLITTSFKFNVKDYKVIVGLHEFKVDNFISGSIAEEIQNSIKNEIESKLKGAVGSKLAQFIDQIGGWINLLPTPDIMGFIINEVIKSRKFEEFIEKEIKSKVGEQVLYAPEKFTLGLPTSPVELSINSPKVTITDEQISISIDVNEL